MNETLFQLPVTVLVMAAEDIDLDAEPEEGQAAEMAEALDAVADAEKRVKYAQKEFEAAAQAFDSIKGKLNRLLKQPEDVQDETSVSNLVEEVERVEELLKNAHKRFLREKAKADNAAREAEALGVTLIDQEKTVEE